MNNEEVVKIWLPKYQMTMEVICQWRTEKKIYWSKYYPKYFVYIILFNYPIILGGSHYYFHFYNTVKIK